MQKHMYVPYKSIQKRAVHKRIPYGISALEREDEEMKLMLVVLLCLVVVFLQC